ncbi:hypothetical protein [Williamsoniiplasma lucivorax]|uniref:Uncharacterized protein n=1 Tax=Williamsoniiplasma lucivorax TaxID=209274 RepID=A0A2S5RFN9_9MOLU|nr:hypothetical protein [Williamsoniiplasma lucivorax]PPE06123.1 hypothetical protein ELUCI_v1c04140 [Williamsoniiplasma lucivorax]
MNKTKIIYFGLRFFDLIKTPYFIGIVFFNLVFGIIFGLISSFGLNAYIDHTNIYFFYVAETLVYSLINILWTIFCFSKLYQYDNVEGVNKMEMRIGLKKHFMYFYRLLIIVLLISISLFTQYMVNTIFYVSTVQIHETHSYRLFISFFGWIAFIAFLTLLISIFLLFIFKAKMTNVFATVVMVLLLIFSALSGNFISNKVKPEPLSRNMIFSSSKSEVIGGGVTSSSDDFSDGDYMGIGNYLNESFEFYQLMENDNKYNFLKMMNEGYLPNETEEINRNNFLELANKKFIEINDVFKSLESKYPNDSWGTETAQDLIQSDDIILSKFGDYLSKAKLRSYANKRVNINETAPRLQSKLYTLLYDAFLLKEKGKIISDADLFKLELFQKFNNKMKNNNFFNPLFGLNLMFYGGNKNYYYDNWDGLNKPLFPQVLNIKFEIAYDQIPLQGNPNDPTNLHDKKIQLKSINHNKVVDSSYLIPINITVFLILLTALYFGYRIRT